jgi:membrane-bound metal-dependent hydrolase YbcI (DUF457 family)
MKRRSTLLICAVGSLLLAGYAAFQCVAASMAGSSLVGLSSHVAAQHHYGALSWIWFTVALVAVIAFVAALIAIRRPDSPVPPSS